VTDRDACSVCGVPADSEHVEPLVELLEADRDARRRLTQRRTTALVEVAWKLADDVGRLRRSAAPPWIVDDLEGRVETALNLVLPTAGDLVRRGMLPEMAAEVAIGRGEEIRRRTGADDDS
jgi:hypothetical protein